MRTPAFWDIVPPDWRARLLAPLGWVYGAVTSRRMRRQGHAAPVPVLCVGNLTAGGAGKTPTVIWVVEQLKAAGVSVVVLSRGHGGRLHGPVVVDPGCHSAAEVGDEPLLLARAAPVIISRNRPAGLDLALARGAGCIVMDDGLQNPSLAKTLTIAVVDARSGIGNGLCVPAGPLRAPLAVQWPHVDHILLIGDGSRGKVVASLAAEAGLPVSCGRLVPDPVVATALAGKPVLAISGIGRPDKFMATLAELGAVVEAEQRFPDHAVYTEADADRLARMARERGLVAVTTEKDAVKLAPLWKEQEHGPLIIVPVTLDVEGDLLRQAILEPCSTIAP